MNWNMTWVKIVATLLFLGISVFWATTWEYDSIDLAIDLSMNSAQTESSSEEKSSAGKGDHSKDPQASGTPEDHSEELSRPYISIVDMHLTPVTFSEENYFYVRFKNGGSAPIENLTATFDLGRSVARRAEVRQGEVCKPIRTTESSTLSFFCEQVEAGRVIDVLLTTDLSSFETISFSSSSLKRVVKYSHEDYVENFINDAPITFQKVLGNILLSVLLGAVIILIGLGMILLFRAAFPKRQ